MSGSADSTLASIAATLPTITSSLLTLNSSVKATFSVQPSPSVGFPYWANGGEPVGVRQPRVDRRQTKGIRDNIVGFPLLGANNDGFDLPELPHNAKRLMPVRNHPQLEFG